MALFQGSHILFGNSPQKLTGRHHREEWVMGVQDRDWFRDRHHPKPQNPDWQKEYTRWYGSPPQSARKQGMHWTLSLMVWVTILLIVYVAAKQLRLTGNAPATGQQVAAMQPAPSMPRPSPQPAPTLQQPSAQPAAPVAGVNKCVINGQTVYTEAPCMQAMRALVGTAVAQTPSNARQREIEEAAAATKRAEEQLARQWDQRMAQRDRDLEAERVVVQQQVAATNKECRNLKAQRDSMLRLSVTTQQQYPWRDNLNYIRRRMNELHC
ncbi:hypothetical protein [Ralstonia solanacearum]|uniref:hypothetical protein n=2 Tax=Ralstonia solanacearum TaxID=305 RepID=UPI001E2E0FB6|nr:hypothetical protein [Ralstonia solanacearum]MDC6178916.1 hypothetical protein [Ralstonia solanacearum]MDC6211671.1 hypothetical protein [Ralstonia solanacearum]MDC6240424.1 hypothetical protein [Ralstonia solanacearum]MDD7802139.1 hypothetical protein [Ralstonia solanacearum]